MRHRAPLDARDELALVRRRLFEAIQQLHLDPGAAFA